MSETIYLTNQLLEKEDLVDQLDYYERLLDVIGSQLPGAFAVAAEFDKEELAKYG